MGYRRKNYRLVWPDSHELSGLEVVLKGMRIGELGKLTELKGMDAENLDVSILEEIAATFANHLVSWNYEDEEGNALPASKESALDMDVRVLMQIVMKWAEVASDVPGPLPKRSSGGAPFPVASIPMDVP